MAGYARLHPGINMQIVEGTSTELAVKVAMRQGDFCICSERVGYGRYIPLMEDEMVAVLPKSHIMAGRASVPIEIFAKEPFIESYPGKESDNSRVLEQFQIRPKVRFSCTDPFAGYSMVEAGLGISMENQLIARRFADRVAVLPLDPAVSIRIGIILPEKRETSPAAESFSAYALAQIKDIFGKTQFNTLMC